MILRVARDLISLISSALRSRAQVASEKPFLENQLVLYLEVLGTAGEAPVARQNLIAPQGENRHGFLNRTSTGIRYSSRPESP